MEHALPRHTAGAPRTWSLCMTSENHGTVGPAGCTFSHAPEKHERVLVVEVPTAAGAPADQINLRLVGARKDLPVAEFQGYVDGEPLVRWLDRDNMPRVGTKLFAEPIAAQAGQVAPAEELARFCPACGSVGDVTPAYRDCCPDGNEARRIPKPLANKCSELFKVALAAMRARAPASPAQAAPLPAGHVRIADLPRIEITLRQAKELVSGFGGHDAEISVFQRPAAWADMPDGLYAFFSDYPDEGSMYLGPTDVDDELAINGEQTTPLPAAPKCGCPSGDGSLRWPCDVHPPEAQASTPGESQEGGA